MLNWKNWDIVKVHHPKLDIAWHYFSTILYNKSSKAKSSFGNKNSNPSSISTFGTTF